jgi:hypothetical protein
MIKIAFEISILRTLTAPADFLVIFKTLRTNDGEGR